MTQHPDITIFGVHPAIFNHEWTQDPLIVAMITVRLRKNVIK